MVFLPISIYVDQSAAMASSVNNHLHRSKNKVLPYSPICDLSRSAALDFVIMIAVIGALGFLLFPHIKFVSLKLIEVTDLGFHLAQDEFSQAPLMYGSIGLSISCASFGIWAVLICTGRKCGNPNCKGLRKAAEFDIQLEMEERVKNMSSNSNSTGKDGVKRGLFELPRDHHRELEAELKKMAPTNGRAVLVFRGRCGCCVGRLEVPGPSKKRMKVKK